MSDSKFNIEYTPDPVCPYCEVTQEDMWEYTFGTSDTVEYNCGSCGERILIARHVSIAYSTYTISDEIIGKNND